MNGLVDLWMKEWVEWLWFRFGQEDGFGFSFMLGIVLGFIDGTVDVADDGPILGLLLGCKLGINDGEVDGANNGGLLGKIF